MDEPTRRRAGTALLLALALGTFTPRAAAAEDTPPSPAKSDGPASAGAPAPEGAKPSSPEGSPPLEARLRETLAPAEREKATLDERLAEAKAKEPSSVVRRYEELLALFGEYLTHLGEAVRAGLEAERLEQQSFELAKKKERALLLLEQTEARRARAKLRIEELEAARGGAKESAGGSASEDRANAGVKEPK